MADDLYTALKQLQGEFQQLGMQRTLSGANEAVRNIRMSELKDEEKVNQLRSIAEQLTFNLAAQGTPASTIEALTGNLAPKQLTPQSAEQAVLFGTEEQRKRGQTILDDKAQKAIDLQNAKMQGMIQAAQLKNDQKQSKLDADRLIKLKTDFNKDKIAEKANMSISSATDIENLLNSNNPIADNAVPTYMARLSGEVGALSEADKKPFGASKDIIGRVEQALKQKATGQLSDQNRLYLAQLADVIKKSAKVKLKDRASVYSKQFGKITGADPNELSGILVPEDAPVQPVSGPSENTTQIAAPGQIPSWAKPRGK